MESVQFHRLLRDRDGGVWAGSASGGAVVHVHRGITDVFGRSDGLSGNVVNALFEDREGSVWVATSEGLDRFHDISAATLSVGQGLSNAYISSVLATKDGSVWAGTSDGLNRWTDGHVTVYRERGAQTAGERSSRVSRTVREVNGPGMPAEGVFSIFEDSLGRVWVSTRRGVGYILNDRFAPLAGVPGGITRAIVEDKQGNLWIANQDSGLFRVPAHIRDVRQIPWATLGHQGPVSAVVADPREAGVWLGFVRGGVARFVGDAIRESYAARDGLPAGKVAHLWLDTNDTLWVATDGGLSRVRNGRVATLNSANGLPCDGVEWGVEDDDHAFWLGTECGLVRISHGELNAWAGAIDEHRPLNRALQTTVFDITDGVRTWVGANYFTAPAVKSPDGRLWYISPDGLGVIDPRHLPFNKLPPPVNIERITADRKTYDADSTGSGHLNLPALVRDLEIDYTALSLVAPEKNRFRYKLEGYDRDWQDSGNRRQAFYTNLAPGSYRFRVKASNNSGVWNETGASLDFSIAPAYYQTAWFRTLAVVTFLALLWSAYRIRLRVIERHQADITALNESLMKAQEQERTRIAGELHDGVMQQISALSLVLGTGKRQPEAEAKKTMADVQRKLIEVGTEVRQLSHNLHPPMLKDAGLPEALRGYCEEFSRVRNIPVSCHADERVKDLSRGAALAVYRIAQEAMGNAVTHGAAQHVDVRLSRSNGLVALTVTDDGKGFDANRIGGVRGLGLINMRERARQLNGRFELNSEPGRGTTVRVTIPFRRAV